MIQEKSLEKSIIEKYLGTPFRWGGDTEAGMDCWQFFKAVYKEIGFDLEGIDPADYPKEYRAPHNHFLENFHKEWKRVEAPRQFDAVLLFDKRGIAGHVGVVLTAGRFIHCTKVGVVVTFLTDPNWSPKIQGFYRLKAMND